MTIKTWEQKDYEAKCAEVEAAYRVIDMLRSMLAALRDTEVELPKPSFGIGRYLSIAGTRDAYTKGQLRDYGDKRAAHARKAALAEAMLEQRDAAIAAIKEEPK